MTHEKTDGTKQRNGHPAVGTTGLEKSKRRLIFQVVRLQRLLTMTGTVLMDGM